MSEAHKIRVATAQYPLDQFPSIDGYQKKLTGWVREAVRHGAQLIVFPEYGSMELGALDPKSATAMDAALEVTAKHLPSLIATARDLAREYGVHILTPSGPERQADGNWRNVTYLVSPDGQLGRQAKVIATPGEREAQIFGHDASSNERPLTVFETALGRIGIAICYDNEFPLLVRALVDAGADIILNPSCTEHVSGSSRIRTGALARALENGVATVVSQTIGTAPFTQIGDVSTGVAAVYVPSEHGLSDTGVLAEGERDEPGFVYAEIDIAHLRHIRRTGEMRNNLDWSLQPGAVPLGQFASITDLRGPGKEQVEVKHGKRGARRG